MNYVDPSKTWYIFTGFSPPCSKCSWHNFACIITYKCDHRYSLPLLVQIFALKIMLRLLYGKFQSLKM